ncbi:carbohydrate ABC transporter permease [Paenibacillus sp. IB182496]|uniref:Carbohydrate ABC transporter permease n=1 Tax=Paenibacillus sabuli TaxID=2772509 RepID=A0A927GRM5_9BACL|nr:carbohydrate ABC transporter permease [Paenibacillus sabuli]MBD2845416.1 carbohydrate ABC transporter permease [Paenibacillus sabuli]
MTRSYSVQRLGLDVLGLAIALVFLVPFYFVGVNSLKSFGDVLANPAGWPEAVQWGNYSRVWEIMRFPSAFANSLLITVGSNLGLIVISSMAAYRMVRHPGRINNTLLLLFVAAMVIPFQSIMIPLVRVASTLGIMNSLWGLGIAYFGFGVSLNLFLYHGFIKSIPREIEESAVVDGCSPYGVFWRIVFPLLKPMTVTIVLLNSLWIWNDFLLPLLFLYDPGLRTIPLATYSFFGQYTKQWDLALAGLVLGVVPIVLFFLAMQRHIIAGITAGSVKG